jgi:hypothetical protein
MRSEAEIAAKVKKFHEENPEVWNWFQWFTNQHIREGFTHLSADYIMHLVRYKTRAGDKHGLFKINNDFVRFYADAWGKYYPEHAKIFQKRKRTLTAS